MNYSHFAFSLVLSFALFSSPLYAGWLSIFGYNSQPDRQPTPQSYAQDAACLRLLQQPVEHNDPDKLNRQIQQFEAALRMGEMGPETKVKLLDRLLTMYREPIRLESPNPFILTNEILTTMAQHPQLFLPIQDLRLAKHLGFFRYSKNENALDDWRHGAKALSFDHFYIMQDHRYVADIIGLLKANRLKSTLRQWGVYKIRFVFLDKVIDLVPMISDGKDTLMVRTGDGHSVWEDDFSSWVEADVIPHLLKPYERFIFAKIRALGITDVQDRFRGGCVSARECGLMILKNLGYEIDPTKPDEIYWTQSEKQKAYFKNRLAATEKVIAALRLAKKLDLVVAVKMVRLINPDGSEEIIQDVMPRSEWDRRTRGRRIEPVGAWSAAEIDGIDMPFEVVELVDYLERRDYEYDSQAKKFILRDQP